jgi:hypothetical protein
MKLGSIVLSALVATVLSQNSVSAQDLDWESHYSKAEKAYASHNLFEARREFLVALKEAQDCKKHQELAQRLENLADTYQSQENSALAQPLFKLARKLKTKFGTT